VRRHGPALVKHPGVPLADEPTGNLDEGTRDEIMALLERRWNDLGLTMVIVTHDSSVAASQEDRPDAQRQADGPGQRAGLARR
jgi:ABC-type lipoprotein export system ATPase subunit